MIILGLNKWSFQWITHFVNYIINIQSYQNTNKIHISFNSFLFACFSIALECCKCARMRFYCTTVLVVLGISLPKREHCWRCNTNGRSQNSLSFLHYKNAPCYGNNHKKNASLAAIARYISITTLLSADFQRKAFLFK